MKLLIKLENGVEMYGCGPKRYSLSVTMTAEYTFHASGCVFTQCGWTLVAEVHGGSEDEVRRNVLAFLTAFHDGE